MQAPCTTRSAVRARVQAPHPFPRSICALDPPALKRLRTLPHAAGAAGTPAGWGGSAGTPDPAEGANTPATQPERKTIWHKIKHAFVGEKLDKERLKALGMGAFASYGVISNLNYGTCLGISWLGFVKLYGVAPTAPGQWKVFLAYYAGLWAVQNFARPLRISLALALAPAFDKLIDDIGAKLGLQKKWAFGVLIVAIGITTSTVLFGTIWLLGGFPPNPVPSS